MNFIYILNTDFLINEENRSEYLKELSPLRREKYESKKLPADKALSLGAAILIKKGLALYGIEEKKAEYIENSPAPRLKSRDDIFFSVSHSSPYALCAFSESETGADIERIKDYNPKTAERFFTEKENLYIESMKTREDKNKAFFSLWTLKESAAKLYGTPLTDALRKYEFIPTESFFIKNNVYYSLFEYDGFMIAAASRKEYFKSVSCVER